MNGSSFRREKQEIATFGLVNNIFPFNLCSARGLQSVIQLMGEKDLYDYWSETYKTHTMDWSQDRARTILAEWQRRFSEEVAELATEEEEEEVGMPPYEVSAFSASQLDSLLDRFAEFSWPRLAAGAAVVTAYAALVLFRWTDVVRSQSGLGVGGVLLVGATVAAGLGLCASLGLRFNAATSQVLPYLAMGLGVDAVFLMVRAYAERLVAPDAPYEVRDFFFLKSRRFVKNLDKQLNLLWLNFDCSIVLCF